MADTITVNPKDFQIEKVTFSLPRKNKFSGKNELVILYDGKTNWVLQAGTASDPISMAGVKHWVPASSKYEVITPDPRWAIAETKSTKDISGKVHSDLYLRDFTEQGKSTYYVYNAVKAIEKKLIEVLANGSAGWDTKLPVEIVDRMMKKPIKEGTEEYPTPTFKIKYRFQAFNKNNKPMTFAESKGDTTGARVYLKTLILDEAGEPVNNNVEYLKPYSQGRWLLKPNPVGLSNNGETFFSFECTRAQVTSGGAVKPNFTFLEDNLEPVPKRQCLEPIVSSA